LFHLYLTLKTESNLLRYRELGKPVVQNCSAVGLFLSFFRKKETKKEEKASRKRRRKKKKKRDRKEEQRRRETSYQMPEARYHGLPQFQFLFNKQDVDSFYATGPILPIL